MLKFIIQNATQVPQDNLWHGVKTKFIFTFLGVIQDYHLYFLWQICIKTCDSIINLSNCLNTNNIYIKNN